MLQRPVSVIELAGYRRRAAELLTRAEQEAVVDLVAYEPDCGDLIRAQAACARSGAGAALYAKNDKGDLTAAEKKELAALVKDMVAQWQRK